MEKEKIEEKVIDIINGYLSKIRRLSTSKEAKKKGYKGELPTYFQADLGFDSLKTVELFLECEKTFEITFTDDEIYNIKTIEELINNIELKLKTNE